MVKVYAAFAMVMIFIAIIAVVLLAPNNADSGNNDMNNGGNSVQTTDNNGSNGNPQTTTEEVTPYDYDLSGFVTLIGYDEVTIDTALVEKYVEDAKKSVASQHTITNNITDRPVQSGDTVNIDYVGKYNGVAFEGGTATGSDLVIGSGNFIPGFEDGLIGANLGDTVDLNLTFPEEYHNADLAGKSVVFTVSINKITETIVPELTDEMIAELGSTIYNTIEGFEKEVRAYYNEAILWDNYVGSCTIVKYPEKELNNYIDQEKAYYTQVAGMYGMTLADYAVAVGYASEDAFMEDLTKSVKNGITTEIVIYQTVRTKGITISDDEYQALGLELALSMGAESLAQLETQYTKQGIMLNLYQKKIVREIMALQQN